MQTEAKIAVHIRWLIRRDLPEVLLIDGSCPEPWEENEFVRRLRQRNCIGMVAECGMDVFGFMIYELHNRLLRLVKMAVHPTWRRQGVGSQMVAKMASKLSSHRRSMLTADIADDQLGAHLFLRAAGFRAIAVRGDVYRFRRGVE